MSFQKGDRVEVIKLKDTCSESFSHCKHAKGEIIMVKPGHYTGDSTQYEVRFDAYTSQCKMICALPEKCLKVLVSYKELI
jgi:hypothetical protein